MRRWILGGAGVVVGVLLLVWFLVLRFPALNGDTTRPPKLFHEPYNGIEFRYPATWSDVRSTRGIAAYRGARGCEVAVQGFGSEPGKTTEDLEQLRKEMAADEPHAQFGTRPAWAGATTPAAAFAMTTTKGKTRQTQWDTVLLNAEDQLIVTETVEEGDAGCLSDLSAFERSFRFFPRDRNSP